MSDIVKMDDFTSDVQEYKDKEKSVAKNFLFGILELGEILKRQRDKWKPSGKWMEYLEKINKHLSGANQIIRVYEYSLEHKTELLKANLSNWNKVNLFLALPTDVRALLAEAVDGKEISTDELRETATRLRGEEHDSMIVDEGLLPELEKITSKDLSKADSLMREVLDEVVEEKPEFGAKDFVRKLAKTVPFITEKSEKVATAFFTLNLAVEQMKKIKRLTLEEKSFWKLKISDRLISLEKLLRDM